MKLRTRLLILFGCVTMLPLILMLLAVTAFGHFQISSLQKNYALGDDKGESSLELLYSGSFKVLDQVTQGLANQLSEEADNNPDHLKDIEWLAGKNTELKEKYSYLLVRCDNSWIYTGSDSVNPAVYDMLPQYDAEGETGSAVTSIYLGGEVQCLVKQIDFLTTNHTEGSLFILTAVSSILPEYRLLGTQIIFCVVMVLIVTSLLLILWIYNSIWAPLAALSKATQEIKGGNLDYRLEVKSTSDEIGHLCQDFEEMRLRLKESTDEKIQYDRESKELISNISHDLKTPLTAIKGYVEGIMDGIANSPEKLDKYIRTIYNKANDMDRLINELTFYSKIDTNKIPYNFEKLHVDSYFKDCVDEIELELSSKGIELGYFNYLQEDAVIIGDPEQLKRVINNIISNSVKYMDKKKGIINIRIKDMDDSIQVEIEDNGRGIAARDLPNIFERFYRTDASRNSAKGGSGIGLSIVKKIIEDHGGRIWATSKEYTGTVMHFIIRKYVEEKIDE